MRGDAHLGLEQPAKIRAVHQSDFFCDQRDRLMGGGQQLDRLVNPAGGDIIRDGDPGSRLE
ncbi:hypothetical protein D3C76_1875370 [compost metagenome]